ncbi:MAG: TolC family protein [Bacteroidota bacterium]|nr:TolC family protein [Bacteroidota bacterium]
MKSLFLNIVFALYAVFATAQNKLSLKQAIETGIANNLDVNQAGLQMEKADINLKQSKASMLPNLNAFGNHGTNQGRSIDPFTNAFINQNVNYANYGASSNILLFNGSFLHNQIKSNALGFEASKMELQQAKDNLTINIILAYLQVLSSEDILEVSREQKSVTDSQVIRLSVLNQSGAIAPSQYFDLKGQLANDEITIVDNHAAVETAKLSLSQLLNIPYDKNMEIERLPEEAFSIMYDNTPEQIYQTALQQFAQIKSVHLRMQSAEKNISSLRGQLYPTLSLNGNINTNYSSVASQEFFVNSTEIPSADYVVINGTQTPVITKQNNYNNKKIAYSNQLNNNLFTTFSLGLNIPLFNAWQVKNKIKLAKIDFKNTQLVEQNTKVILQQSIERAYINLTSSSDKYKLLLSQVNSFNESFRAAEIRFNAGASTSVDFLIAKNNLDKARSNLIISKYDFVLREKVLDYYQGKALW